MPPTEAHPSHKTRFSDASSFDEICIYCGQTDGLGTWGELLKPCLKNLKYESEDKSENHS